MFLVEQPVRCSREKGFVQVILSDPPPQFESKPFSGLSLEAISPPKSVSKPFSSFESEEGGRRITLRWVRI
ncbi:hypothetical protein CC2G_014800 [Coprinopsis cinerea AmutBmut pab1-1]|nr:hypothetical protein CC2G_014800 [Coprinopsis cinerea AmutBmut pab1-1]